MTAWCVRHKQMVALFAALLLFGGAASYLSLRRQENPAVTAPVVLVQCVYPGAAPADVEKSVLRPLENALAALQGVKHLESVAMPNAGLVRVYLLDMSDADIREKYNEIRDCVSRAEADLPAEAEKPVVQTDLTSAYGLVLALSSVAAPPSALHEAALDIESALRRIPGVTEVSLTGEAEEEILVQMDMTKMEQYDLAPQTLASIIAAGNASLPGGNLDLGGYSLPVRLDSEYESVADLLDIVVAVAPDTGLPVYLRHVATVTRAERPESERALAGSEPAVLIAVKYAEDGNIVSIGRAARAETQRLAAAVAPAMTLAVLTDQAVFTEEAINLFLQNFLMAVLLVVLVVWLVMGLRSALIVSFPIALVVAAVLGTMLFLDIPLHQVSVASLIISLSLLVANGIVASDNIYLFLEEGRDRFTACTEGVRQVVTPILTSTLTTIASFLPLALMQGVAGKFAYSLPILVSVALLMSFFTALTVTPAGAHKYLRLKKSNDRQNARYFTGWLNRALNHPGRVTLAFAAALAFSALMIPGLGVQIFPPLERDQYALEITAPSGFTTEATEGLALRVSALLAAEPSVRDFACVTGGGLPKYNMTFVPAQQGAHKAEFLVNGDRSEAAAVAERISRAVPNAIPRVKFLEFNMPQVYPVGIRVSGDDMAVLRRVAEEVEALVAPLDSVQSAEISSGQQSYELRQTVNEEKAALAGITNYEIAAAVRLAVNGAEVSRLKEDDLRRDPIPIILRAAADQMDSREALDRIFLTSQVTGAHVPLRRLVRTETATALSRITRHDFERTVTVGLFPAEGAGVGAVIASCRDALRDYALPEGYTLSFGGENEFTSDTLGSMVMPALLAVLIIYVVLALQFGNLVSPLIIMGTIPLSFIGIICGLRLFGYPIGFMALLGAVSLMGVVVNNGIVLLSHVQAKRQEGASPREAVFAAAVVRLRPIVIGMVTTVISLLPMMLAGGTLWAPLATTVIMGMLVSTLSTMFVIPCLYCLIYQR
ncbi:MAG: efflux RND transporter permease subunit [Gracilibacteraceae bacterium]|jgi:multidrug efflux pump subunit AcrB|nr:efflux RND transporter permease subunit [Gracilibacteraceae bacterium]